MWFFLSGSGGLASLPLSDLAAKKQLIFLFLFTENNGLHFSYSVGANMGFKIYLTLRVVEEKQFYSILVEFVALNILLYSAMK